MSCAEACAGGCDLACERRATWRPDPRRQHPGLPRLLSSMVLEVGRTHSTRFVPNGKGGGDVEVARLLEGGALGIWKRVARKRPFTVEAA